ncbi:uncharacterized protein LOC108624591 isoform X2 [Ceratina calcarata]|uniref:Uncharacterized protein LOC108624591 isoform X2 n=1 Tax=Ceratina calcarata TaxID=156304 RepID=A0AAJ7IY82_9HYME|nr:uncharacterized protein LOC108624591 isoform X2 [Ceratina calcarata]
MKLSKLRSGRAKHNVSPSKSPSTPPASSVTPQRKKILRSSSKSTEIPRPLRASKKLTKELNSSIESQEKLIIKDNKSEQLKSSISDNDANETYDLSNSFSSGGKEKPKKRKSTPTNRKRKVKRLSPSMKTSPKSPTLKSKLRSSKLPISKTSIDGCLVNNKKVSPKKNKSLSPLKRLSNVGDRNVASTSKRHNLSTKASPKKHELKEPVVRLKRLSKIVMAECSSLPSPKVKIFINDELLTDHNVNVTQDIFDSIHSPKLSNRKRSALVASTPKTQQVLDATLTVESEQEAKNDTYELLEPKTPRLRKAMNEKEDVKNQILQCDIKGKTARQSMVKKKGNVQFTSPLLQYKSRNRSVQNKRNDSLKISPKNSRINISKSVTAISRSNNSMHGKISVANNSLVSSRLRKSSSFPNATASSPFPSIKTPDPKSSGKKTMPNFAEIHKKMFAKSESIIDAKKRVQDRHTALTRLENGDATGIKTVANKLPKVNQSSSGTKNGFTRFGFKLRKPEATACILKTKTPNPRRSTEQNRAILKGVRTNRRFELQMKMRNKCKEVSNMC